MPGFLFDEIVFGPVKSRRLGISLGINLLPTTHKLCSFNCVYCECGWTSSHLASESPLYSREQIFQSLKEHLTDLQERNFPPDAITFAGNGEPTLHPDFELIINDTLQLRDTFFPNARVAVLSNATQLHNTSVVHALTRVDLNILKLDAGTEETFRNINQALIPVSINEIINGMLHFPGKKIIQSLFLRGKFQGKLIDNTSEKELIPWISAVKKIHPEYVMIYSIDRLTPASELQKVSYDELQLIAQRIQNEGIKVKVY